MIEDDVFAAPIANSGGRICHHHEWIARKTRKLGRHCHGIVTLPEEGRTMVRLTNRRRVMLAEKFGDLANLAIAALVFGQVIGQNRFVVGLALAGFAIWLLFMGGSFFLAGEDQ